jgi:hypothetical protein
MNSNTAVGVMCDGLVVVLANGSDPNVQYVVHRRQIGHPLAVGRNERRCLFGVAEEHVTGDYWYR